MIIAATHKIIEGIPSPNIRQRKIIATIKSMNPSNLTSINFSNSLYLKTYTLCKFIQKCPGNSVWIEYKVPNLGVVGSNPISGVP